MAAARWNIVIEQGATWRRPLTIDDPNEFGAMVPRPLTDFTGRMHIREYTDSATTIIELTTENGRIALVDPGVVVLLLSATDTSALPLWEHAVYDLELVAPDGTVDRILQGDVRISPEVTR